MKRLDNIIQMLSLVQNEEQTNERIWTAKGKYKMPKNFKDGYKLAKRNRKYGNTN